MISSRCVYSVYSWSAMHPRQWSPAKNRYTNGTVTISVGHWVAAGQSLRPCTLWHLMPLTMPALSIVSRPHNFCESRHLMPLTMPALSSVRARDAAHDARAFQRLPATTFAILPSPRRTATPTVRLHQRFASMADMSEDAATPHRHGTTSSFRLRFNNKYVHR